MKNLLAGLLLATSLTLTAPIVAQSMLVKTIEFSGASQSQAELLTLSGLTPGKTYTKDDIEAAMGRLDQSGLFSSVQYSTRPGVLTFTLEPSARAQMQRVRYANFPWYTQAELNDAVHARLPLFTGSVPADGALKDQVAQTLVSILKQRGIDARVESQGVSGGSLEYKIMSPQVVVTDLRIDKVRWDSDPLLDSVRKAQLNVDYLEGITQRGVHGNLEYALMELGFLEANVGPIGHDEPKLEGNKIGVVMTGTVTPGDRYKVGKVTLPTPVGTVTARELADSEFQVKAGGLPSPSLVKNTTARMASVFQGHGFLDAGSSVDSSRDLAAHTVSYTFGVVPGEVYHLRDVLYAPDLTAEQKAQLAGAWKLPKGAVFERAPVNRMQLDLKSLCGGRPPAEKLLPAPATHEVDVSLSCKAQAGPSSVAGILK